MLPCWQTARDGVRLAVRVQPGARRCQVIGAARDAAGYRLRLAVTAPPEDGRANRAACALVAAALGVAERNVQVVQGETSRQKMLLILGDPQVLTERLSAL